MVYITLCRCLVGAENGRWEEAAMHLMLQHHCSSTDLALMLFLVGSPLFSLSSTCPPQASEKTLGLARCFCCILQREAILSVGIVRFIPPIQTACSNDPNRALKHSSWCWWFACHHHHSAPILIYPTIAIESDYWEFVDRPISLWWFCHLYSLWHYYHMNCMYM